MTRVHRTLAGEWEVCEAPGCLLFFHFPNTTVEELTATPLAMLLPVFEVLDLPEVSLNGQHKWWSEPNPAGVGPDLFHRDYGLPALIHGESMHWYVHGKRHRGGGQPAVVKPSGEVEYWVDGIRVDPVAETS